MTTEFLHGIETIEIDDGVRTLQTVRSSLIGIVGTAPDADPATFPLNVPVLISGPRAAGELGLTGTLRDTYLDIYSQGVNLAVVVRVEEGADAAATLANVTGDPVAGSGIYALLDAKATIGQTPRILAAPGFTASEGVSATVTALLAVADRTRSVVIADGPGTTEAAALNLATLYDNQRLYMVDPDAVVTRGTGLMSRPGSGLAAGALSARDQERGFWWSPSNQVLEGVAGTGRPVGFALSDAQTESNRLNEVGIATIVRQNGFRLWGNRSLSTDPLWSFLSVRRTADIIYETLERGHLWALDRPFSPQLLISVRNTVQEYLDSLVRRGALIGGTCTIDPEVNTAAELQAGRLFMDFDIEPPAPLERLTFRARRNGDYYDELVADAAATI